MKPKHNLLILASAILLVFSFPNFLQKTTVVGTSFFMWFAWAPAFYLVAAARSGKGAFYGAFAPAFLSYMGSLYWLCNVGPMGPFAYVSWVILCIYFASLAGLCGWAARELKERAGLDHLFTIPALFTAAEFFREWAFTGWPVLTPAQSQHQFIPALQLLKYTGVHGLNYLIFSVNMALAAYAAGRSPDIRKWENLVWAALCLMLLGLTVAANIPGRPPQTVIRAAVLQPNIDQNVSWDSHYREYNMKVYKELYDRIAPAGPSVYIWPETGFPGVFGLDEKGRQQVASWTGPGRCSIVGSDHVEGTKQDPKYYNAVFSISPEAGLSGPYAKYHLVPFGEYVPFASSIPFIKKVVQRYGYVGFTRGQEIKPLRACGALAGPLVCYDSFFPEIARAQARQGAGYLVHLSYETWYGNTPASAQIFTNAALRSAETGLAMARCVASGISGFTDGSGRITAATKLFTRDAITSDIAVRKAGDLTPYVRYGDWFAWQVILLLAAACLAGMLRR